MHNKALHIKDLQEPIGKNPSLLEKSKRSI